MPTEPPTKTALSLLHAAPEEQLGRRCAAALDTHGLPAALSKTIDR